MYICSSYFKVYKHLGYVFRVLNITFYAYPGISNALFYLHANQLVHGSLNANHVLLNDRFTPKLYNCCGENSKRSKLVIFIFVY